MNWIEYREEKLAELPENIRNNAIQCLKNRISETAKSEFKRKIAANPETWWCENTWHFSGGMWIRNYLRDNVCVDTELPSKNWDDYYISVLEEAVGYDPYLPVLVPEEHITLYDDWDKW